MQTFVPELTFEGCAMVLDKYRLNSQAREALILLGGGWYNHPAAKMWGPWQESLGLYAHAILDECDKRGIKTTVHRNRLIALLGDRDSLRLELPSWWGHTLVHASHRARLLQKDYDYYSQFGWTKPEHGDAFRINTAALKTVNPLCFDQWKDMNYEWPTFSENGAYGHDTYPVWPYYLKSSALPPPTPEQERQRRLRRYERKRQ